MSTIFVSRWLPVSRVPIEVVLKSNGCGEVKLSEQNQLDLETVLANNTCSEAGIDEITKCDPPCENRDKDESMLTTHFHFKTKEFDVSMLRAFRILPHNWIFCFTAYSKNNQSVTYRTKRDPSNKKVCETSKQKLCAKPTQSSKHSEKPFQGILSTWHSIFARKTETLRYGLLHPSFFTFGLHDLLTSWKKKKIL